MGFAPRHEKFFSGFTFARHARDVGTLTARMKLQRAGDFYCDVERRLVNCNYGRKIVVAKKPSSIAIKFNLGHRAVFDARL